MSYGHALALLQACAVAGCTRHAVVRDDEDGSLWCAVHALARA